MKSIQKHPNYYQKLLLKGARVASPLKMVAGAEKGKGRVWTATATLILPNLTIYLEASFLGNLAETEEVAQACLIINKIIDTSVTTPVKHVRNSYGLLALDSGIYTAGILSRADIGLIRDLCSYNASLFCGVPTEAELTIVYEVGFRPLIVW